MIIGDIKKKERTTERKTPRSDRNGHFVEPRRTSTDFIFLYFRHDADFSIKTRGKKRKENNRDRKGVECTGSGANRCERHRSTIAHSEAAWRGRTTASSARRPHAMSETSTEYPYQIERDIMIHQTVEGPGKRCVEKGGGKGEGTEVTGEGGGCGRWRSPMALHRLPGTTLYSRL